MTTPEDDGFLSRWSARKRSATGVPEDQTDEIADLGEESQDPLPDPEKSDAEILEELDLPDPDTLGKGDDFTKFMTSAVPARLRNRALRRLWLTDPVLANLDEMIDYGEDFTDAATVVENMKTVYDSVRGMLPEEIEEEQADGDAETEDERDQNEDAVDAEETDDHEVVAALNGDALDAKAPALGVDEPPASIENPNHIPPTFDETPVARPQRMRFRFDGA